MDQRAPWIIAGAIVAAAVMIAFAVVTTSDKAEAPLPALSEEAFVSARTEAQDRAAQSDLRYALAAAKTHFTDGNTYDGWIPETAALIAPDLVWLGNGPAAPGVVTINLAGGPYVVMSTMSNSGQVFCIADTATGPGTVFGRIDMDGAQNGSACTGDWY